MEYIKNIADLELYIIVGLVVFTLWFIFNTKKFYHGEKRKVKNLHRFAKEGEAEAQHDLARRYQKGKMVKKNCDQAAFWYQRAFGTKELLFPVMKKPKAIYKSF
jgi:hypothetical protein